MRIHALRTASSSLLFVACICANISAAYAQETGSVVIKEQPKIRTEFVTVSDVDLKNDFLVSPTRFARVLEPGESATFEISVLNRDGKEMTYEILRQDFAPDPEKDDVIIYPNVDGPYSARDWVSTAAEFTIKHGERAYIPVTISVPAKASVGDHYTALMIQRKALPDGKGIGIISRVGILLLITANGDVVRSGNLLSFSADSPLFWSRRSSLAMQYKNTGTVHLIPTGIVKITNIFGVVVDEIPFQDWYVYRESFRSRHLIWEPRFALGRYTASVSITDAAHESPIVARTSFWVLPILPLIIILIMILFVSFLTQLLLSRYEIRKKERIDNIG